MYTANYYSFIWLKWIWHLFKNILWGISMVVSWRYWRYLWWREGQCKRSYWSSKMHQIMGKPSFTLLWRKIQRGPTVWIVFAQYHTTSWKQYKRCLFCQWQNFFGENPPTVDDIKAQIRQGDFTFISKLRYYSEGIRGSDGFWRKKQRSYKLGLTFTSRAITAH